MTRQQWKLSPWWLVGGFGGAIAIWLIYFWVIVAAFGFRWGESGVFGDTFGALGAFFSVLTFFAVLLSFHRDHKHREWSARLEGYEALLISLQHQMEAARNSGADANAIGDIAAKQRLASEQLEEFLTGKRAQPLLSDEDIIKAFLKIPWFTEAQLRPEIPQLRTRLRRWGLIAPEDVLALTERKDIADIISELYREELKRPHGAPFDPGAMAVWGGLMFRNGTSAGVIDHIRNDLRQSEEARLLKRL